MQYYKEKSTGRTYANTYTHVTNPLYGCEHKLVDMITGRVIMVLAYSLPKYFTRMNYRVYKK